MVGYLALCCSCFFAGSLSRVLLLLLLLLLLFLFLLLVPECLPLFVAYRSAGRSNLGVKQRGFKYSILEAEDARVQRRERVHELAPKATRVLNARVLVVADQQLELQVLLGQSLMLPFE